MKYLSEVVIYKTLTIDDILDILELAHSGSGSVHLLEGITVSKLSNGNLVFEIIETDYGYEE
jgi:hypothetical protein